MSTGLIRLVSAADLVPDLEAVGLLLGENDPAFVVLGLLDQHVDLVTDLDENVAAFVHELPGIDEPLGLEADVHLDLVGVDRQDLSLDDLPFL
jgi:hypothetical protein